MTEAGIGSSEEPALGDIHPDPTQRVVVDTHRMAWESSPSGSVWRKPLYRQGGDSGR